MLIDFHAHVHDYENGAFTREIVREARRIGIDYLVISEPIIGNRDNLEEVQYRNDLNFETCAREPDFLIPFVYTHPNLGQEAVDEVNRGFDRGARGIKLEVASIITDKCVEPIIELAIAHDVPLMQHTWHKITGNLTWETDGVHCAEIGRRYPELKLVMAHISGDNRWGIRAIRVVPSVYTDCSGSISDYGHIEECVRHLGADRLLWGTDARGADFLYTLAKVRDSKLSDDDKAKVLGLNAAKLLKLI